MKAWAIERNGELCITAGGVFAAPYERSTWFSFKENQNWYSGSNVSDFIKTAKERGYSAVEVEIKKIKKPSKLKGDKR